jgi:hypothetical protein
MEHAMSITVRHKISLVIFIISTLILVPLRIWQVLYLVDPLSGFYKKITFTTNLVPIILAVTFVLLLFFSLPIKLFNKSKDEYTSVPTNNSFVVASIFILSVSFIVNAIMELSLLLTNSSVYTDIAAYTSKSYDNGMYIVSLLEILCGLFFLYLVVRLRNHQNKVPSGSFAIACLIPAIYSGVNLLVRFMRFTTIITNSLHLFEVIMLICIFISFSGMARILSGVSSTKGEFKLFSFGLFAALLSLFNILPQFALFFRDFKNKTVLFPDFIYLAISLFFLSLCFSLAFKRKVKEE